MSDTGTVASAGSRTWYLRRAVPWVPMSAFLAVAATLAAAARHWPEIAGTAVVLVVLVAAAAAGFVFDEPAVAVTHVTPRGSRWSPALRIGCAAITLAGCLPLLVATGLESGVADWMLVAAALVTGVVAVSLALARRQLAHPGGPVAGGVVLAGLAPVVLAPWLDVSLPLPDPSLSCTESVAWLAALTIGVAGLVHLVIWRG